MRLFRKRPSKKQLLEKIVELGIEKNNLEKYIKELHAISEKIKSDTDEKHDWNVKLVEKQIEELRSTYKKVRTLCEKMESQKEETMRFKDIAWDQKKLISKLQNKHFKKFYYMDERFKIHEEEKYLMNEKNGFYEFRKNPNFEKYPVHYSRQAAEVYRMRIKKNLMG